MRNTVGKRIQLDIMNQNVKCSPLARYQGKDGALTGSMKDLAELDRVHPEQSRRDTMPVQDGRNQTGFPRTIQIFSSCFAGKN